MMACSYNYQPKDQSPQCSTRSHTEDKCEQCGVAVKDHYHDKPITTTILIGLLQRSLSIHGDLPIALYDYDSDGRGMFPKCVEFGVDTFLKVDDKWITKKTIEFA